MPRSPIPLRQPSELAQRIRQALGNSPADLVVHNVGILDLVLGRTTIGDIAIAHDRIVGIGERYHGLREIDGDGLLAVPGFVDAHVHVESSLVTPEEFDRQVLAHGTTTAICDPHEIANVLGAEGLRYMLDAALGLDIDLRFKLPSCVPATALETSGARLDAADLLAFRDHPLVLGLAEMMNVPGVLSGDPTVIDKLAAFSDRPIDGHAPLVGGQTLNACAAAGIRNDHESVSLEEAEDKLRRGIQVILREGSAAKSVAALASLLSEATSPFLAFCTDDRNPLDIARDGHIDHCIRTALAAGAPATAVFRAAAWSAARAQGLDDRGLIAPGYLADIVLLDDLESCHIHTVVRAGKIVGDAQCVRHPPAPPIGTRSVKLAPVDAGLFAVPAEGPTGPVIGIRPGQLITDRLSETLPYVNGCRLANPEHDVLKICVLERHGINHNVGRGFVGGFGLRSGALASTVAHDSHNIIVVGDDDRAMTLAVNRLINMQGGFVAVHDDTVVAELALPVAGLMSDQPFETVCAHLDDLHRTTAAMGCRLHAPFHTLSFLALPVIPHLKITDRGLVDVDRFELLPA